MGKSLSSTATSHSVWWGNGGAGGSGSGCWTFYERDIELRLNAPLFVVKGGLAGQMLEEGGGKEGGTVIKRLESIELDTQFQSDSGIRTVKEVLGQLSENGCGLVRR